MTFFIMILLVFLMFVFVNVLFYVVVLLFFTLLLLIWMVSSGYMSTLMMLLVMIVYIGAMMILIGYICAVCPNFVLISYNKLYPFLSIFFVSFMYYMVEVNVLTKSSFMIDYFFSLWGLLLFFVLAFMLFFTLLMVTSQYNIPQGPFRSII